MPKYTVQNPQGKKVTFQWDDPNPPTDADMEEVFSAAGAPSTLEPVAPTPEPSRIPEGASGMESMARAVLPRSFKAEEEGAGVLRKATAGALDAVSAGGRAVAATTENPITPFAYAGAPNSPKPGETGSFSPEGGRKFADSMADTNGKTLPGMIARDPATIPSLVMGGPATAALGKMALGGLKAGLTTAGLHQGDRAARGQGVSGGEAAAEVAINTVAPVALKGVGAMVKGGIGKVKTILSKFSDVDEAALKAASDPATLQAAQDVTRRTGGDLSGMADDLGKRTEAMQADEAQAAASVNASRQQTLQGGMLRARLGAPNSKLSDVSAYDAGKGIETAAKSGMQSAGERFGLGQDEILVNRGIGKKGLQFGGPDGNQTPFEQTVDRYLAEAGVGQGGKNYGVIGNVSIPAGAINEIRSMKGVFQTGLNTRDMLDQLRLVDNRLNFGGDAGGRLFAPGSQEDMAMKGLRARLADDLEAQIGRAAGKNKNAVVAAWGAHREAYHKTAEAFEKIQDGIGAGKVNQETYFNRIKNIGVEDLRKLAAEAKTNPDVSPTWNELRKGFFDNILASGIKDDGIDYNAIKKTWDAMDDDLKTVMMPTKVISHVDGVLDRTKPIDFKGQGIADNNRMVGRDRQSLLGSLENIGSRAKRSDLEDLKTLDDLLGLEGKDRFSEQASSFYLGKQLGMTDKGALPLFTGTRNGAKLAGAGIGATLGGVAGASQGGAEGGGVGTGAGMLAGVALQSPAGALAAYKLLNQMRKGVVSGERNIARPLAQRGLSAGRVLRVPTTSTFGGERDK